MKKTVLLLMLLISVGVYSQIDTEFWFAVPELTTDHVPDSIQFCFASFEQPANIVVSQPAITDPSDPDYLEPIKISIPANSYKVLYLKSYRARGIVEIGPRRGVLPFGFLITSDVPVSAYYAQTYKNSEIYTMKGRNALGKEFIVPMQNSFGNGLRGRSSIEIVATEDDTQVNITTLVPTLNRPTPGTFSITLNRGEAYAIGAVGSSAGDHLQNTRITATKPIAVNSTDDSVDRYGQQDLVGDQLVPVDLAGDSYVAIKNTGNVERIYVFAIESNTKIYINNVLKQTINPGSVFTMDLVDKATLITSGENKKFLVFQLTSYNSEFGGTMLPKITCTGSSEIVYRQAFSQPIVNLLVKTEYISYFSVNGVKSNQLNFTPVPSDPLWSYCSEPVASVGGIIRIKNDSVPFHAAILDSGDGTFSYGYFSDYNTASLFPRTSKSYYQIGETVELSLLDNAAFEDIVWIRPDGSRVKQDELVFTATESTAGIYRVEATHKEGCPIEFSFNVVVHVIKPEAYNDSVCKDDFLELTARGYAPYIWKSRDGELLGNTKTISVSPDEKTHYTVNNFRVGENLFFNGDFQLGNQDFGSDYPESSSLATSGSYTITPNASKIVQGLNNVYDHTTGKLGSGNYMLVKCAGVPNQKVWTRRVDLERNMQYEFSAWLVTPTESGQQSSLQLKINGQPVSNIITPPHSVSIDPGTKELPDYWQHFSCIWNSGSRSSVDISIETAEGVPAGSVVCIDDVYFSPLFEVTDTVHVDLNVITKPVITGDAYLVSGEARLDAGIMENDIPYVSYCWYAPDGSVIGNEREITVTEPGEYSVEVTNGSCVETDRFTVSILEVDKLEVQIPLETEICDGEPDIYIDYSVIDGEPDTYSVYYDNKAQQGGFVDKTGEALSGDLILSVPMNVVPDVYHAEIQFFDTVAGTETSRLPIEITVKYNPDKILKQKWNDVLVLYNEDYNGGYYFISYQWYKNGEPIKGENHSYLYLKDSEFNPDDLYSALLVRNDGVKLFTCDFTPEKKTDEKPFPTVVTSLQLITLDDITAPGTASFFTVGGALFSVQHISKTSPVIKVPDMKGLFILSITSGKKNEQHIINVR